MSRFEHGAPLPVVETEDPEAAKLVCENNAGCGAGLHCANGACVAECDTEHPCTDEGRECDIRGRCVLKPEPCPTTTTESTGTVDSEIPYDMGSDKASEKDEEEERKERRRRRRERREREEREKREEGRASDEN